MADGAPQRLAELWYGVEVSATKQHSLLVAAARFGEQILLPHPSLRPAKQFLMNCVKLKTQSHSLPPAKQFLMNCDDVEDSVPLSSTSEAVPYELR